MLHELHTPRGVKNQELKVDFLYMIAEVFLHQISSGKNLIVKGQLGVPKVGRSKIFSNMSSEKL